MMTGRSVGPLCALAPPHRGATPEAWISRRAGLGFSKEPAKSGLGVARLLTMPPAALTGAGPTASITGWRPRP
jgi:hypothetical protein